MFRTLIGPWSNAKNLLSDYNFQAAIGTDKPNLEEQSLCRAVGHPKIFVGAHTPPEAAEPARNVASASQWGRAPVFF